MSYPGRQVGRQPAPAPTHLVAALFTLCPTFLRGPVLGGRGAGGAGIQEAARTLHWEPGAQSRTGSTSSKSGSVPLAPGTPVPLIREGRQAVCSEGPSELSGEVTALPGASLSVLAPAARGSGSSPSSALTCPCSAWKAAFPHEGPVFPAQAWETPAPPSIWSRRAGRTGGPQGTSPRTRKDSGHQAPCPVSGLETLY